MWQQAVDQIDFSFQEFGGGVFLVRGGEKAGADQLAGVISRSGSSVSRAEEDCNRFFAVADFFDEHAPSARYSEEDLLGFASAFAAALRAKLSSAFPDKRFAVEVVGENLVDEEPLELCITFSTVA